MSVRPGWRRLSWIVPAMVVAALALPCAAQPRAAGGSADSSTGLLMGPYVNGVSQGEAHIHYVCSPGAKSECAVTGGPDEAGGPKVQMSTFALTGGPTEVVHSAAVTGLKPGRKYQYVVTVAGQRAEGAFVTAPAAGSRDPFTFIVFGDPQGHPSRHQKVAEAIVREPAPAFLLILGDYTDDGNSWPLWKREFFDPAREVLRRSTTWTIRGNHDQMRGASFKELFQLYNESPNYSFDYGNLHVVCLDQFKDQKAGELDEAGEAKLAEWVDKDLSASKAQWKIAVFHEPIFNVGGHGSTWGRQTVLPVLRKHGVDICLSGHSHLYERFLPLADKGGKPILQIVSGGGGGTTYPSEPSPALAVTYSGIHYLSVNVSGDKLQVTAKTPDGNVLDTFSLVHTAGLYQKEVMDAVMEPNMAMGLMKVFKFARTSVNVVPKASAECTAVIAAGTYPPLWQVRIGKGKDCAWTVKPAEFADGSGDLKVTVSPPTDAKLAATPWDGVLSPPLSFSVSLTYGGRTFSSESVDAMMSPEVLRKLLPPEHSASAAKAPGEIKIDGRLDDWKGVAPVPAGSGTGKALRLAWGPAGLYGAVSAPGGKAESNPRQPTESLELCIEMDARHRLSYKEKMPIARLLICPTGDGAGGPASVQVRFGASFKKEQVSAAWKKTDAGYDLEFLIPAEALAPAKMAAGTTLGFQSILTVGGQPVESFVDTAMFQSMASTPMFWGTLRLTDK